MNGELNVQTAEHSMLWKIQHFIAKFRRTIMGAPKVRLPFQPAKVSITLAFSVALHIICNCLVVFITSQNNKVLGGLHFPNVVTLILNLCPPKLAFV